MTADVLCYYFRWQTTHLYVPVKDHQWPIIYSPEYSITLCGIERLQAYDTCKGSNIFASLKGRYIPDLVSYYRVIQYHMQLYMHL